MATAKVAITLEEQTLKELDRLVKKKVFPNRSMAIQTALAEKLAALDRETFELECRKLNPTIEKEYSEEDFEADTKWPEY